MTISTRLVLALMAILLGACATTIPVGERESVRQELNDRTEETLALLLEKQPELQASLDTAVGYFVARLSGAQVAVVGGAIGIGVLYDKEAATRTYMNVTRYDLGLGAGAGAFRVVYCDASIWAGRESEGPRKPGAIRWWKLLEGGVDGFRAGIHT